MTDLLLLACSHGEAHSVPHARSSDLNDVPENSRFMKNTPAPSLFQRLLLSHLFLLFLSFFGAVFLYQRLFAPGVKMFLVHSPFLIIPVVLFLMLVAASLASWMAGIIESQLQTIMTKLRRWTGDDVPDHPPRRARLHELDMCIEQLDAALVKDARSMVDVPVVPARTEPLGSQGGILHIVLDRDWCIVTADVAVASFLHGEILSGTPFVFAFCAASYRASVEARGRLLLAAEGRVTDLVTRTTLPDGRSVTVLWNSIPGPVDQPSLDDHLHLLGSHVLE
jgi:hypothetical protein